MNRRQPHLTLAQQQERVGLLRAEMDRVGDPEPEREAELPTTETLEELVEKKIKHQLTTSAGKDLGPAIVNAIKFLAVKAKIPVAFGSALDETVE